MEKFPFKIAGLAVLIQRSISHKQLITQFSHENKVLEQTVTKNINLENNRSRFWLIPAFELEIVYLSLPVLRSRNLFQAAGNKEKMYK